MTYAALFGCLSLAVLFAALIHFLTAHALFEAKDDEVFWKIWATLLGHTMFIFGLLYEVTFK